jgi:hypothetical protein
MAKRAKTPLPPIVNGVRLVRLTSWQDFFPFINGAMRDPQDYVFRGQRRSSWKAESSLDRALRETGRVADAARVARRHLHEFRLAIRGRRGANPQMLTENQRWALGQHYDLWTPLLDWTESPFVGLYFAFEKPSSGQRGARAVFALSQPLVRSKSRNIEQEELESAARADVLEIIRPMTDENTRLVSQGGLFTRGPFGVDIEKWVRIHFAGNSKNAALVKIIVPEEEDDRLEILRALNRMNINHRSLFPDVTGSAKFCNMRLAVAEY